MPNIEAFVFTASGGIEIGNAAIRLETNTEGPVGEWKLTLNNTTDASQLLKAGQYIILGADQHTLMKGYVEDILPEVTDEKSVFYKTVTVKGLNAGRDLLKHLIHANFVNPKLGDLMDVTLKATGSNIRVFPNLIGQGPVIKNCKAKDTYVIDLFNEAGQEAGYWWLYNWDDNYIYAGPLQNTLHTNITLTSIANDVKNNNILLIDPHSIIGSSIVNWVKVKAGSMNDHLTEFSSQYWTVYKHGILGGDGTGSVSKFDDTEIAAVGAASLRINCNNVQHSEGTSHGAITYGHFGPEVRLTFPQFNYGDFLDYENIPSENCHVYIAHNYSATLQFDKARIYIVITDTEGRRLSWKSDKIKNGEWTKVDFVLGYNAPSPNVIQISRAIGKWERCPDNPGGATGTFTPGKFNWKIKSIGFEFHPDPFINASTGYFTGDFWVDGLCIPTLGINNDGAFYIAQDTNSMDEYNVKSMISLFRPELKSQLDLQRVADETLAVSKDPPGLLLPIKTDK